jgi:hypothetical protein
MISIQVVIVNQEHISKIHLTVHIYKRESIYMCLQKKGVGREQDIDRDMLTVYGSGRA